MVKAYQAKFGLDKPLHVQYFNFLGDTFTLDLGYSLANYPARVGQIIGNAIPWTIGLMIVSVLIGFALGTLMGALSAWPSAPRFMRNLAVPLMTMSAIPPYLLGLIVLYILGLKLDLFPLSGGYSPGMLAIFSLRLCPRCVAPFDSASAGHCLAAGRLLGAGDAGDDGSRPRARITSRWPRPMVCAIARSFSDLACATPCCRSLQRWGCRWPTWSPVKSSSR